MRQFIDKLLRPQRNQLISFSILVSPILIYGTMEILFSWFFFDFVKILYAGLIFSVFVTWLHDKYNKTKLKSYVYVTTMLLTTFLVTLYPNKKYLKSSTETKAILLGQFIENYRIQHNYYPKNLNEKFFNEAPKRYFFRKVFHYRIDSTDKNNNYCVVTYSIGDLNGVYNTQSKELFYHD